jgi:hypothetical protein
MLPLSKRVIGWGGLTALLGALSFAIPAHAGSGVHIKCTNGVGPAKLDRRIPLTGGKANYTITFDNLSCTATEAPPVKIVTIVADVTSTGEVKSPGLGCLTAKWTSDNPGGVVVGDIAVSAGSKVGAAGYEGVLEDLKYQIEFAGGAGTVYWHNTIGKAPIPAVKPQEGILDADKPYSEKSEYLGGTAKIQYPGFLRTDKPPAVPSDTHCTKAFDFTWAIDISDPLVP